MVRLFRGVCGGAVFTLVVVVFGLSVLLLSTKNHRHSNNIHHQEPSPSFSRIEEEVKTVRNLGYFFALKYYEQQTQATKNFLQMQCLASSYGMQVVEPFLVESQLAFPFSRLGQDQPVNFRFGDIIDLNLWNQQTQENYGYPAVASWGQFLDSAPRNLVIVCVRYRDPPIIKVPSPGYNYRNGCSKSCFMSFDSAVNFLSNKYDFVLVRKVCANFANYAGSVTSEGFLENILGMRYSSSNVTVILNQFRGFFGLYRIQVLSPCGLLTHSNTKVSVLPSKRLVREAKLYASTNFANRSYTSIMVRAEKIVLHSHLNLSHCAALALAKVWMLGLQHGVKDFFLTMDIGRFGSYGAQLNKQVYIEGAQFFQHLYGKKWSIAQWEYSFVKAAASINPAYIANLQRTVAARGACLLMVGAGGFQAQARSLYERYHPNISTQCIHKICAD